MIFQQEWILECIVMHMKTPRLYEHNRKLKIMVVPSSSCLRTYVRKYKSGFGFNEEVLMAIAEKARTIDPYHRHDDILIDEMKLSENLTVNSQGKVDGFVDLGKYSSPGQEGAQCDHGLVILFQPFTGKWKQILGAFGA